MSQRDKILVAGFATLAAVFGGWFFMAKPKRAEMRTLDTQIEAKRSELAGVSARAAQYRAARESLRNNPQAFRQAGKALPNRVAMSELLRTLSRTAKSTGVQMSDLATAGGTSTTPGINSVDLSLTFDGSFLELQRFFSKLQKFVKVSRQKVAAQGRLLALNGIALAPGADGTTKLSAKVTATAYILQPGALTVGATTPAAAAPATPGATPAAAAPAPTATPTTPGAATP